MLEDHADALAGDAQLAVAEAGDEPAVDGDLAAVGPFQQVDGADERALARAALTDNTEDLAAADLEADVVEGHGAAVADAEGLADVTDGDHALPGVCA